MAFCDLFKEFQPIRVDEDIYLRQHEPEKDARPFWEIYSDEENFKYFLNTKDLPDVDLLIRTSGEERISNFLLYELAYAEFIFNKKFWPEYSPQELRQDLEKFNLRTRRYGGLTDGKQ